MRKVVAPKSLQLDGKLPSHVSTLVHWPSSVTQGRVALSAKAA